MPPAHIAPRRRRLVAMRVPGGRHTPNDSHYVTVSKLQNLTHTTRGPFNKLKQLAVNSDSMTDEDKILEYNKLLAKYSKDDNEINDAIKAHKEETKNPDAISAKRFSNITKKLDATINSISKFKIEKISSPDDRKVFIEKLDAIIAEAQEKKTSLEKLG